MALRRRYPIPVLAATLPTALTMDVLYESFQFAGALVALYSVAAHVGRPRSIHIGVATALGLAITNIDESRLGWVELGAIYAVFAAAWLLGDNLRTRRAYLRELEERAARLEREREENVRRATAEEQARIARELHDIIAHNVSVMPVQAAAAGDAFETHPSRVREAAATVLAGSLEAPSASLLVQTAGWLALVTGLSLVLALGVSSLLGSRGTSIGILLGWQLVAMPLLLQIGPLGSLREGLVWAAVQRLEPAALLEDAALVPMSLAAAVVVLLAWTFVPLALGAWRTCTRDA